MALSPEIMASVEQLGYRVTVGDVTTQTGVQLNVVQQGLLALASDSGGHLQVTNSGEIVYLFPHNFKTIIRNKYWKFYIKEIWGKIWNTLFYLIRISFGIILIASVFLMMITVAIIIVTISYNNDRDRESKENSTTSDRANFIFIPNFSDLFHLFYFHHNDESYQDKLYQNSEIKRNRKEDELNFLEAIFSFLFGDGNPNHNLEEYRWREIGSVISNNNGAIIAQQIYPYLDNITKDNEDNEDYILPVLTRFNGHPKVSPMGEIVYYFPELQLTAQVHKKNLVTSYLKEKPYHFSRANSRQVMLSIGLGTFNFILALVLGYLIKDPEYINQITGLVSFVGSIYWMLLVYATAFLVTPLIRYFWIQWRNDKIEYRNNLRQERAKNLLELNEALQHKIKYACEFAAEKLITNADISYTTEKNVLEQEF